ncbi:MAG: CbtA family protein [Rhodospirillaceae bacterium]|nr:CbtA family protein [Rhodospirillaceae bacterium]MCY4067396.1 CbtA family protein [Rhodospirillaceae bacterium]MDE0702815.1 CbtA family protein [Rhodospirillaceae bacterium]
MFTRIAVSALFAGFAAGLVAALLQLVFVQPVLLHAELYESGALNHFGDGGEGAAAAIPGIDLARDGLSVLFTTLTYTGFAFLLVAAMALAEDRGVRIAVRQGLVWGVAGFLAVQLAPALGAPPELPGSAAAEIGPRQIWWFGTVGATAAGLALIAFGRGWALRGVAALLLLAPHVIGAPHPDEFIGPAPPELASLFAARALGTGLAAWSLLGLLAAYFWQRESKRAEGMVRAA